MNTNAALNKDAPMISVTQWTPEISRAVTIKAQNKAVVTVHTVRIVRFFNIEFSSKQEAGITPRTRSVVDEG